MSFSKLLLTVVVLGSFLFALPGRAEQLPELTAFLREQINTANQSLRQKPVGATSLAAPLTIPLTAALTDSYVLRYWYLRLRALVGVDVPWIASFQIVPEVELMFESHRSGR
jgi:hypothetical protein